MNWLIYTLFATVLYGLWAFFSKLATNYINSSSVLIYQTIGNLLVGLVVLNRIGFKPQMDTLGIIYALLVGVIGMVATLFFTIALSKGSISVVVTITALYPAVSIVLGFLILKESITLLHCIGIALAVIAMVLFAI